MRTNATKGEQGFSLLELMASMAILIVVMGVIFSAMVFFQKNYQGTQIRSDMHSGIRGATELISQEVGQAGSIGLPANTQLNSSVTANSTTAQAVSLTNVNFIFVGEQLLIDAGANEELVSVTAVNTGSNTITGIFSKSHATNMPVKALGVFPQGILSSSTGTSLKLFGDTNDDRKIHYVEYNCDTTAGTLTRSSTPITANGKNVANTLLDTLTANPGGAPCFSYTSQTSAGYTFITSVKLTLTLQSSVADLQTGGNVVRVDDFLNLSPRNILAGFELASNNVVARLQPTPPNVPLP